MSAAKLTVLLHLSVLSCAILPMTRSSLILNKLMPLHNRYVDHTESGKEFTKFTKNVEADELQRSDCKCENGKCVSQGNHEVCICNPGFGKIDDSKCKDCKCGNGFNCTFDVGFFTTSKKCICPKGFVEKDGVCKDCSCGLRNTTCELIQGIKECACPNGYRDSRGVCVDIDECVFPYICPPNSKCINTPGSYECACEEGYQPMSNLSDTRVDGCQDIDECLIPGTCPFNSTICINLPGSYKCTCLEGFQPINKLGDPRYTRCREDKASWQTVNIIFGVLISGFLLITLTAVFIRYRMALQRRRGDLLSNSF
ncbi:latent-transforming growth factor beta-binding protein 2 [Nephila pilipes]|uniref:Latent-transforming growth factor beta-binding protein 2 n=1 Tax=Nephila pilipes TaxID=299642 RepID=A0A8X6TB26_NEPPI|nr:latent-transforming growth factor beta-binding protein 2 [Nephila pilipes]